MRAVLFQNAERQNARPLRLLDGVPEVVCAQFLPVSRELLLGGTGSRYRQWHNQGQQETSHVNSSREESPLRIVQRDGFVEKDLNRFYERNIATRVDGL